MPRLAVHCLKATSLKSTLDEVTAAPNSSASAPPLLPDKQLVKLELLSVNGELFTTFCVISPSPPADAALQSLTVVVLTLKTFVSESALVRRINDIAPPKPLVA